MSTGDELRLGKFGNQGQVNTDSLKGGVKREAAEKAGFGNIFDAFDDGNGVLTDNEINTLKQGITDSAKHGKDSIFSQNEAEEYIQKFNQNAQANSQKTLKDVNAQKLFDFLKFVEQQAQSVISSSVDSDNNAVTKYKNELGQEVTEIIHQDTKTTEQVVVANGKEIRTFLNAEGKKEKEIETNQQTGAVMTTIYGSDGKTIKTKTVEEKSGKKTVTEYQTADGEQEAKPVKATITNGTTVEEQTLVNGELKTTHRIENKGKSNQKDIEIKYNENGRTETVTENGQTYTVEYIGSNRVITKKNGTTQDVTTENGQKKEVITTENSSDTTTNIYNLSDKKLSQTKVIKGKEYSVTYDGNGNTTGIVVQYGENAEKIAKKFGITKEALLKANGKNEGEDFKAGDTIIIPKELEADDKNLKGRKSSADAIKDQKRAEERARRREIARQRAIALDKQYRAAGLKNYEHKGEKFQYGNETYTVIGTMNNRARLMVKDSKGNIVIASHDHKILKDSYVQLTTAYDKGQKVTMRNGQKVVVLNSRGDKHGRMIGLDEHGRQVVISGGKSKTDLSDRVVLNNSYVEASDVRDIVMTRIETAKDDNERKAVISQNRSYSSENIIRCKGKNGKVWYFDITTGKAVNLTKQEAAAITRELDDAAGGMGTDEAQLAKANGAIVDPAVLAEINKYYESQGYTAGEYKSAYEAFLASEISDSEIYEANADLVNNNAILDQARRDEILLTNLTTFGGESANRNKALRAIGTRTDYNNLQLSLAQHNRANGYNAHFKGQDALQTTLYNITNGNVAEIDAANRALIDSNETILTRDEIVRIQAEVGAMYLEKGDSRNATRSQDAEVLAAMDNLTTADGQKIDVKSKAGRVDLMIAGYGDFSDEEIAQEVIKYLKLADKNLNAVMDDLGAVAVGEGHEFDKVNMASIDHQEFEDYATKAHQLIKNFNILTIVKKEMGKEYSRIVSRIEFETSERENLLDANSKKPPKINFSNMLLSKTTAENLSNEEYEQNMQLLNPIRAAVYSLEAQHLDAVDGEGWKLDFVNQLRQQMFLGTTRADVTNQYAMSKAALNKLELAAKGQLVDANGNKVSFEDAVEQLTGKTVQDLQAINQEYVEHQAYGEMGVDLTVGLVTMVIPVPGLGVGKLVSVGGKVYKVAQVVNAAKNEYKLVNVAISGMEVAAKMKAVQYTIDRTNIATSVSGNTLENRGAVEDKSDEVAMYSAAGVVAGGATSILSSRMSSTLGRATVNGLGFGADLASSAYISQQFHGGNFTDYLRLTNEDGTLNTANILNTVMTGAGYAQGLRVGRNTPELPPIKPQEPPVETPKLDAISKDAKPRTVYIKTEEKFKEIKQEVEAKLKTITSEADLDALKKQVDVIQNRDMRHELEHVIDARRAEIKKSVVDPTPEPAPEPKTEPAPEPKPIDDPTVEIVNNKTIFNNLSEGLKKAWQNIEDAISTMTTIADFHAIKSNISNYFSGKADAFNALMTKLNSKVKQLGLNVGHNGGQQIADIKPSVHNKLAKGHSYEIDQNVHFKAGDDVYSFDDFSPELRERINNLKDGESLKIGRNDIDQYNDLISREHLIVKKENGKLHIEDISTNGTMILDEANAKAFKSLQELKRSNRNMNTSEYLANEAKFLEAVGNDYDLLNKLVTSNVIDLNSHSFTNIMTSTNANNKVILEQFLNNPQSIQSGNRFSSAKISQEDLSLLMLFNRNNSNAASIVSSPSQVKDFLTNAKKELNNLRQVYASDPINGNLSNSEIADAIQSGKTQMSDGTFVEVTPNTNILDDIENLIHGKDYIQHFSNNDNLITIFAKTQTGDVASINGQMFVNDGTQMVRLSLSESTFKELFPPVQRFSMHQGAIGTCYLDTSINILANSRKGRAKLYQMIGEETINGEKKLYTTTANGNGKKEYFNRFTRSGRNLRDRNGLAIIEQGYCMNSKRHALDHSEVTRIMIENEGGNGVQAISGLTGDNGIQVFTKEEMANKIRNLAGRDDVFIYAASNSGDGTGHSTAVNKKYNIYQGHAYTVKKYDADLDIVYVANPWHSGVDIPIPMNEFLNSYKRLDIAQIM